MTHKDTNEQRDVLASKGNVLKSGRGLQIWGPEGDDLADAPQGDAAGGHGNASMGTAARQGKGGYMAGAKDAQPARAREESKDPPKAGAAEADEDPDA